VDPRCAMELDEILPSEWAKLEAATDEYIAAVSDQLDDCVAVLTAGLPDANGAVGTAGPAAAASLRLGASTPSVTTAILKGPAAGQLHDLPTSAKDRTRA